jgi:hypothetical protein
MSAVFGRRRRLFAVAVVLFAAASLGATPLQADTVSVNIDEARVMKLPEQVATIVIGNPLVADASLQAGGILVLTAKGYGSTNMLALDRTGKVVMDKTVVVLSPSPATQDLVVVYKGIERESYSCSPECAPRIMLGDSTPYFAATMNQSGLRSGQAATPAQAR